MVVLKLMCLFMWTMGGRYDPQRNCAGKIQVNGVQHACRWVFKMHLEKLKGHHKNLDPGRGR